MARNIAVGVAIVMLLIAGGSIAADTGKEKAAGVATEKWLIMVDRGNYVQSWKEAAEYFKGAVSQEQWGHSLQAVRKPLGKIISRKVITKTYQTTLSGAPDGEYIVIQFETSFQNRKSAIETVTAMLDKDGQWRVAGYFIK